MFNLHDTIAALASAAGPGGRGIVRCSGPDVVALLSQRFQAVDQQAWLNCSRATRHTGDWPLMSAERSLPVDIYLWPNHRSYTGQPQAELHTIGSPPLLEALLSDLFALGARPAQKGEFTLRAFLAGRVDLMQAEAVLGVIDSADQRELQTALAQLAGGVSHRLTIMRVEMLDLLADLEAGLDFTEEGLEFVSRAALVERISGTREELERLLNRADARNRQRVRSRVVIAGRPNSGKSTLFNALIGRSAALVSPIAGTTRDYLTAEVDWHGVPLELVDTAGVEDAPDDIMQLALSLGSEQVARADLVLQCCPADHMELGSIQQSGQPRLLKVLTKSDVVSLSQQTAGDWFPVSARTGSGIVDLRVRIADALRVESAGETDILGSTAARCRDSLQGAIAALARAAELAADGGGDEFLATDVREALDELGRITGAVYTDDLLDRIFSKFCIGK